MCIRDRDYCDNRIVEDYNLLEERKIDKINHVPDNLTIQYLYARSYFKYAVSDELAEANKYYTCLLYTSPSPRDRTRSRMPSSA